MLNTGILFYDGHFLHEPRFYLRRLRLRLSPVLFPGSFRSRLWFCFLSFLFGFYESGQTLELTGTEFTLLYLLAQHLGQVVSREHLSQEVLGKRLTPFDRAIDMHISNLRRKLPDRKDGHPWFKTLRGRGYLMVSAS